MASRPGKPRKTADGRAEFPPAESSGYLVRDAHRAFQRLLEKRIAPYGVARGQWYFLRVLWTEDGLSQRELSARVGMMEPTTVIALRSMERAGLIRRVRSSDDKRKAQVWLTPKAQRRRGGRLAPRRARAVPADDRAHDGEFGSDQEIRLRLRVPAERALARESRDPRGRTGGRAAVLRSASLALGPLVPLAPQVGFTRLAHVRVPDLG